MTEQVTRRRGSLPTVWNDPALNQELERLWEQHGGSVKKIARAMGRTPGSIAGRSRVMGLQFHGGNHSVVLDAASSPMRRMRTIYKAQVREPGPGLLKSGDNQRKLGKFVTKGPLAGLPIYSLTLEERATCPPDCAMLAACYGNNMGLAKRYKHGEPLMIQLFRELSVLQRTRGAFLVRLHILGDFFSVSYVDFWEMALDMLPGLYVFGYTAWQKGTPIGDAVASLRDRRWKRFAVRTSGAKHGPRTLVAQSPSKVPHMSVMCPAQTGKTKNCGTCALCWAEAIKHRPIVFTQH